MEHSRANAGHVHLAIYPGWEVSGGWDRQQRIWQQWHCHSPIGVQHITKGAESGFHIKHGAVDIHFSHRLALTPRANIVWVFAQPLSCATARLVDPQHALWAQDGFQGPDFWRTSWSAPKTRNLVFFMLTWSPLHSTPPSHALSMEMHFSWVCAMSTRSLVKSCSHCTPVWNSRDSTSSSRMKSSGLRTEPWCTPTPTPNSPLYWPLTCTWLWTLEYMPWMTRTTHCSTPRLHKAAGSSLPHNRRLSQSLWRQSRDEDGVSGTSTRHKA